MIDESKPQPPPKSFPLLSLTLGFLVVLFLSSTVFLAYQNMKLTRQIVQLQKPIPSPTPTVSSDPTVNWKTYTNNEQDFSMKYPNTWLEPVKTPESTRVDYKFNPGGLDITIGFYYDQTLQRQKTYDEEVAAQEKNAAGKKNIVIGNITKTIYINTIGASTIEETVLFKGKGQNIIWISMIFPPTTDPSIFDQILSTFTFTNNQSDGQPCGGTANQQCPAGYSCQSTAMFPNTGGTCVKDTTYQCPPNGYVDCTPQPNMGVKYECTPEAFTWFKANCPNFKGGAL